MLSASNTTGLYFLQSRNQYLYHYTPTETALCRILPSRRLRMSPFTVTRDPRENKDWIFSFGARRSFDNVPGAEFTSLQREATRLAKNTCKLLCLTEDDEAAVEGGIDKIYGRGFCRPRMWAQYAENHKGACLILDRDRLRAAIEASIEASSRLYEGSVTYRNRSQAAPWVGDPFTLDFDSIRAHGLEPTIHAHIDAYWRELFFEKAADWADEKEFRWVVWDTRREHHFVNLGDALRAVVIGPDFNESLGPGLQQLAEEYDCQVAQLNWKNGVPEVVPRKWIHSGTRLRWFCLLRSLPRRKARKTE